MSRYRDDLAYGEDYYGGGGAPANRRWDRERFERMKAQVPAREGESFRFEEDDYHRRGPERERVRVEVDERRGGGRDYYEPPREEDARYRRRPAYLDADRYAEVGSRELAHYRPARQEAAEFRRPTLLRRQTSLDTFDRRRAPRYDQDEEEERDVRVNVDISAPEAPRARYRDEDYRDEDYRDVVIRKERHRDIYRRRRDSSHGRSSGGSAAEDVVVEKVRVREKEREKEEKVKKGRTRFPKRLVHLHAILDLGYPYEEEEFFYHVLVALKKDKIDDVIERSKGYFQEESFKITETKLLEAPAPSESHHDSGDDAGEAEVIETKTTRIITNPTREELERLQRDAEAPPSISSVKSPSVQSASIKSPSPSRSRHRSRHRSHHRGRSSRRSEVVEEEEQDTEEFKETREVRDTRETSLAIVMPKRERSRHRRELDEEIRRLEIAKLEIRRGGGHQREYDTETVYKEESEEEERQLDGGEVRISKDGHGGLQFERRRPHRRSKSSRRGATERDVKVAAFALS